jgi:TIR domain
MATIILSYRREDTELMVGRICDRLRDHYGRNSVMMDIDSIPYGLDFRKHIREALSRCDLMVAIIGPHWAALNDQGQSRLIDETDWIRIEIEAALAKDIPVIPVLVNGAPMPKPKDLPESMQDLAFRQAAPLDMRRDFHTHMDRLIGVMDELLTPKTEDEPVVIKQDHTVCRECVHQTLAAKVRGANGEGRNPKGAGQKGEDPSTRANAKAGAARA